MEATGIDADTQLEISTDGDVIVISPVRSKKRTAKLEEILGKLDSGSPGIRDVGLLESALAMPEAVAFGEDLHPTLHEKAAAYLFT